MSPFETGESPVFGGGGAVEYEILRCGGASPGEFRESFKAAAIPGDGVEGLLGGSLLLFAGGAQNPPQT